MKRETFNFTNTAIRRTIVKGCAVELSTTAIDNAHFKHVYAVYLPERGDFEIIVKSAANAVSEIIENEQEWEFLAQLMEG
mgnify:CR=1 FL=1